jgi:serine/threonine-protein kinase
MVGGPQIAEPDPPSRDRRRTGTPVRKEGFTMGVEAQNNPPLTGKMLGPYHVLSRLAVGGMAELWLANSSARGDSQQVVLKTMLPGVADSREFVRMFQTEAVIGSRLRHPNLVRVLDYGRLADRYFIAMEYIDGLTLRQIGQRFHDLHRRFPPRLLLSIVVEVCRGLHTAHELRDRGGLVEFVHRDVSPENIMVTRQGVAKLIDFGAASTLRIRPTTGRFVGKFRYVAPERLEGKPEDRRCDIYSLGVILYEYLTGVRPFEGDDLAMMARILEGPPRPPHELVHDLPRELDATILRALSLRPDDRQPTAAALAVELTPLLDGRSLPPPLHEEQRLLEQVFAHPLDEAAAAEGATPTETDAKTVEMEVDALKEVLSRTREDPTVVRRMRVERRGRTMVGEPRDRPPRHDPRPAPARPGVRRSIHVQTLSAPAVAEVMAAASPPPPAPRLTEETQPLVSGMGRRSVTPARLADTLLLADALPLAADRPPDQPPPADDGDAFSAAPPQPPVIAPPPVELAEAAPAAAVALPVAPTWLFERREAGAAEHAFPDRAPALPPGWFDLHRPDVTGPRVLDRPDARPAEAAPGEGSPVERRRAPMPEAVRCFDRGLSLLQDKLFAAALEEWERAAQLDPENRMYQVNLKRLRERVSTQSNPNPRSVTHEHEERESQ